MELWVAVAASGTLGIIVSEIGRFLRSAVSGKATEKREYAADLVKQRDEALAIAEEERRRASREQDRADREARNRNRAQDYASELRRAAIEAGIPLRDLPKSPLYERNEP